ncbi:MAG: hypothetical protein R2705_05230 [Ilumatobacteraceae bacterium]
MHIADRLELPAGYCARPFRGAADFPAMAEILTDHRLRNGEPERVDAAQIESSYRHPSDATPNSTSSWSSTRVH